jgi:two-component system, OmpR family, sensor histidine kinase MtrB
MNIRSVFEGWRTHAGLRRRTMTYFALGGLLVSVVLATATYVIAREYLIHLRERSALRQAYADARFVRDGLLSPDASPTQVIGDISLPAGSRILIRASGRWYSSELEGRPSNLPTPLTSTVDNGSPGLVWAELDGREAVVVGLPLPAVRAQYYEVLPVVELQRTLGILRGVLIGVGVVTAFAAAVLGRSAAAWVMRPLDQVATAASAIAAGKINTRVAGTADPDLVAIVGSFNTMVDALANRIERETRFTADVSHELRSPLTALVTGVELLAAHRNDLPERSRNALDVVTRELDRFRRTLEDLLQLARLDADNPTDAGDRTETDLRELVRHVLHDHGREHDVAGEPATGATTHPVVVRVNRRQVERALLNLIDNADRYGGGLRAVDVETDGTSAYLFVDDHGPGVPTDQRDHIFARFARGAAPRGSGLGTGLGLSIVAETMRQHGGTAWCTDRPGGLGARFVIRLPLMPDGPAYDEEDDAAAAVVEPRPVTGPTAGPI